MSAKTRKSSTRLFDVTPLESFSGKNLPTNKDVLWRFFSIKDKLENKAEKNTSIPIQIPVWWIESTIQQSSYNNEKR